MRRQKPKASQAIPKRRTREASEMLARVGKRVELIRSRRAMSRKRLAELSGVSLAYLSRLESGRGNISLQLLQSVANALGVTMESLVTEERSRNFDLDIICEMLRAQPREEIARLRAEVAESYGRSDAARSKRICLIGLRGAGKSTLGERLAQKLGRAFVELDTEIERETGLGIREIFENLGQAEFRRAERSCLERLVKLDEAMVIATAGGIVSEPGTFAYLLSNCLTAYLKATPEQHLSRVVQQHDNRITAPEIRKEAMEVVRSTLEAREHLYERADVVLDTTGRSVEASVRALERALSAHPGWVTKVRAKA